MYKNTVCAEWKWVIASGILMAICGLLGLIYAGLATFASVILFGALAISVGIMQVLQAYVNAHGQLFIVNAALGLLWVGAGILMLMYPVITAMTLTLILAIVLLVMGITRMVMSFTLQIKHRIWLFINGLCGLLLGGLILYQWPLSSLWIIGIYLSIDMLFVGSASIALGLNCRRFCSTGNCPDEVVHG